MYKDGNYYKLRFNESVVEDIGVGGLFVVITLSASMLGYFLGVVMGKRP